MIRHDHLISKVKTLLQEYLQPMMASADKPRKKFLRQTVGAVLLSGSLVVSEFGRWIHDDCSDLFYRIKRLLNHLVSPAAQMDLIVQAYRQSMAAQISSDTPIIMDMTDLAKPRARKMKYLALVRDGSEDKIVPGYWCLEVYAYLKEKNIIPLALDVFSIDDPAVGSENLRIERTLQALDNTLSHKGIWIADRGFDRLEVLQILFSLKARFVIRQRGDRHVIVGKGVRISVYDLAERLYQRQANQGNRRRIIFCPVRLPRCPEPLFMVAHFREGYERPLMLLTNMVVLNPSQAGQIIDYYLKRWSCEEAVSFLKSRVGFERFRIRRYEAIQHLALLAMLAMGFLSWILLRNRMVTGLLFKLTSKFRKNVAFQYYRLLDGLQQLAMIQLINKGSLLMEPP
jgi:hypothetical protein